MTPTLLVWLSRGLLLALGAGAILALGRWVRSAMGEQRERWAVRTAWGMLLLALVYAAGHARLLAGRETIEEGRELYARYGDPRLAELRRAEVRGWILDCTGEEENALARYEEAEGEIERVYSLGRAGFNFVGGGTAEGEDRERGFTVERLFAERLREPRRWGEAAQPHPSGRDLRLTLCGGATRQAWQLLREADRPGAVIVQEVNTGAIVAYAATGGPDEAPLGFRRYAPPGSTFKLALAALWWEGGMPDTTMQCPASIQITPRATISNSGGRDYGTVSVPEEMLVFSCNTTAVQMALEMREQLGTEAFVEAYRRFGFLPYPDADETPTETDQQFWSTSSERWARGMAPEPARIRIGEETGRAEWAQLAIGQGPVDATVIAMSRFVQAIGNEGVMLEPTIEWERGEDPERVGRVMSEQTAAKLQAAMREVVDRGTARRVAPILQNTGWDLGGKTGTAQRRGRPDDGWFAGLIFDADETPRYSIVVYLEGGGPGGGQPAQIAAGMTRFLADNPPVQGEESA